MVEIVVVIDFIVIMLGEDNHVTILNVEMKWSVRAKPKLFSHFESSALPAKCSIRASYFCKRQIGYTSSELSSGLYCRVILL
jgi:hypothetical protein